MQSLKTYYCIFLSRKIGLDCEIDWFGALSTDLACVGEGKRNGAYKIRR